MMNFSWESTMDEEMTILRDNHTLGLTTLL